VPALFPGGHGLVLSHIPSFASAQRMLYGSSAIAVKESREAKTLWM
jgi:hypothetical protein